jgi:hypothetical protein
MGKFSVVSALSRLSFGSRRYSICRGILTRSRRLWFRAGWFLAGRGHAKFHLRHPASRTSSDNRLDRFS